MQRMVIFQIVLWVLLLIFLGFLLFTGNGNLLPNTSVSLENTTIIQSGLVVAKSLL